MVMVVVMCVVVVVSQQPQEEQAGPPLYPPSQLKVPTYVANQKYEAPQKIPGEYRAGATVGTNKMGLTYGDLQPYSKCKIKYPGNWRKVKGHMVYSDAGWTDGQQWSVKYPKWVPTGEQKMVTYFNFLSDYSGPKDPEGWKMLLALYKRDKNIPNIQEMLEVGAELPPWFRSGPLAFTDLISKVCR